MQREIGHYSSNTWSTGVAFLCNFAFPCLTTVKVFPVRRSCQFSLLIKIQFLALYARESSNNDTSGSIRKRSRFDEVGSGNGSLGRDSREDRDYRERSDHRDRDTRDRSSRERDYKSSRSEYRERERDTKAESRERSENREREPRERESRTTQSRDRDPEAIEPRERSGRDSRETEQLRERESRDNSRDSRDRHEYSSSKRRHTDESRDHDYEPRDRERSERDRRDYDRHRRDDYRSHRDSRDNYRDYNRDGRRSNSNVEIPFDQFLRLSPWRGQAIPLEERPRHLKNWDAAPAGFERISADKAKLTGLFPPPGNIAKTSNYVPPTLDPARAAMFQMLNRDPAALPSSQSHADNSSASNANLPANLMKQARRFYVGNLPFEFHEPTLLSFLEENLRGLSGSSSSKDESKVLSIAVSTDRSYAFVECRSAEDASLAMNLDGVVFEGSQLKVRRPKEYHMAITSGVLSSTGSPAAHVTGASALTSTTSAASNSQVNKRQIGISGIPDVLTAEHVKALLGLVADIRYFLLLKDRETDKSLGVAVFEFSEDEEGQEWSGPFLKHSKGTLFMGPFEMKFTRVCDLLDGDSSSQEGTDELRNLLSVYNLQPGYATAPSSTPVLQMLNLVTRESLQADYDVIYEDIKTELIKYSEKDLELIIPRPTTDSASAIVPGIGKVFAKFGSLDEAAKAASELAGRIFDGHTCIVAFYPVDKFEKRLF